MSQSKNNGFRSPQDGFILTLELILIISILGIGLFVGFSAIRDALFKYYTSQSSGDVYVSDANGTVFGNSTASTNMKPL